MNAPQPRQRGSKELWFDAAYEMLVSEGIESVKVMALAKQLNLSRTGFYWFFEDLNQLHDEMIDRWEKQNTGTLVDRCNMDANNIREALFNVMDCWLEPALFDARLDLAIRNWARVNTELKRRLSNADDRRIEALAEMFRRHGFSRQQSKARSLTVIYTQIGYISMQVEENRQDRLTRVQHYVEFFAGSAPTTKEIDRFLQRHS
jgi:AcrR family transcriptional regulator